MVAITKEKMGSASLTNGYSDDIINRIVPPVKQRDEKRAELAKILFDDKQKSRVLRSYRAIEIIEEVHLAHKDNHGLFFQELGKQKELIGKFDLELLRIIERNEGVHGVDPIMQRIYTIFKNTIFKNYPKERVFEHFKRYYAAYSGKLEALDNKEAGFAIRDLVREFLLDYGTRKTQIDGVNVFMNKVSGWYAANGSINGYVIELEGYVRKLQSLKDGKIDRLLSSVDVQRILAYPREMNLLRDTLRRISVGEKEATWKDFLNIYSGMGGIIRALKEKYFDEKTSNELMLCLKDERHFGQQPEAWKRKFQEIIYRLQQEGVIIEGAKVILQKLFREVVLRINELLDEGIRGVVKKMEKIIGKVSEMPGKTIRDLVRVVKSKKRLADKKIKDKRRMYEKHKNAAHSVVIAFNNAVEKFFVELDTDNFSDNALRLDEENAGVARTMANTSNKFTNKNPGYDAAITARLTGLAAGIRVNEDRMSSMALRVVENTASNYRTLRFKVGDTIKGLDNLIVYLLSLIENYEGK